MFAGEFRNYITSSSSCTKAMIFPSSWNSFSLPKSSNTLFRVSFGCSSVKMYNCCSLLNPKPAKDRIFLC